VPLLSCFQNALTSFEMRSPPLRILKRGQVETETANEFAAGANIPFLETSAKNATNVEDAFMKVTPRTRALAHSCTRTLIRTNTRARARARDG
jgi:hypothetical protein